MQWQDLLEEFSKSPAILWYMPYIYIKIKKPQDVEKKDCHNEKTFV